MTSRPAHPRPEVLEQVRRLAADPDMVRLEGMHCVKHALRFGADVVLLMTEDRTSALQLARNVAPDIVAQLTADLIEVGHGGLRNLVGPGRFEVIGFAHRTGAGSTDAVAPAVLLEEPRNLGNVGAVVRVAAGLGARAVWTTGSVDPWHPAVVRAAAGLHFAVGVERMATLDALPAHPLLGFDPTGDDLRSVLVPPGAVLAFGSERRGLSSDLRRRADRLVAIPMRAHMSSYNLATSVAIALYHWSRTERGE